MPLLSNDITATCFCFPNDITATCLYFPDKIVLCRVLEHRSLRVPLIEEDLKELRAQEDKTRKKDEREPLVEGGHNLIQVRISV